MITLVLGTRPEIIKFSPVIRAAEAATIDYCVIHTGQHYSFEMDQVFFAELDLPAPTFNLDVGSGTHAVQTGAIMAGVERVLMEKNCSEVLVQGDTNTVLAGALAAKKLQIRVGHVEAGLRSFDRTMPEEINRVVADHIADHLFAPTETSRSNLLAEGIADDTITVTGNTIVDALYQNREIAEEKCSTLQAMGLESRDYLLATFHRAENVDNQVRLAGVLEGLARVHADTGLPVIVPVHPRTAKMIDQFNLDPKGVTLVPPQGFLEFLQLEAEAALVLTDSGGVQEETCILKVPCVTLRENTERPETITVGANLLAGTDPARIEQAAAMMLGRTRDWVNPFGDGKAGERILQVCTAELER
ncbi:non-hydrolyzing UDP-N-acetylglucosamine 2-epimerase [Methanosphaerula palustris]|uniref:UDP-N-acetylglucosamine 2-epimerase n=1 Tax=Methanosphaerula palustris (strain ATCC BAA-1556 / DSM 19958 / E1-9c) TaxID=521011 RepID=B8GFD4_METPE|nr:UDP-N-acetylglucosamine 2-epimerase (non-hydrolyzing) [Methanosphaerula palustris]ACL15982.1 UDP-N-acetylglucosamine 2-epimerase [Methanosphaerula palustris E1-9c]